MDAGAGFLSFLYFGCRLTKGNSAWFDAYGVPGGSASSGRKGVFCCEELGLAAGGVVLFRMMDSGRSALSGSLPKGNRGLGSGCEELPVEPVAMSRIGRR